MKITYNKNTLIVILIYTITFLPSNVFCQSAELIDTQLSKNISKYWHYRERLKYFTTTGHESSGDTGGEGLVAGIRNELGTADPQDNWSLNFDEEAVYLGYYLGVLATEYKLLSENNANYDKTLTELYYALNAYIYQMDKCENIWSETKKFDGFFIRAHISPLFTYFNSADLNEGLTANDNGFCGGSGLFGACGQNGYCTNCQPAGLPGYVTSASPINGTEPMSQDQCIGLLTGLALVAKYLPSDPVIIHNNNGTPFSYSIADTAKLIAKK